MYHNDGEPNGLLQGSIIFLDLCMLLTTLFFLLLSDLVETVLDCSSGNACDLHLKGVYLDCQMWFHSQSWQAFLSLWKQILN
jgi:hypothetical protein